MRDAIWWGAYIVFNLWAAYSDVRVRRVPNNLLVIGAVAQVLWLIGFSLNDASPLVGAQGMDDALPAFALGLCFVVCWKLRIMGAGDVKFLAVQGLMLGLKPWLLALLLGTVLCGLHAALQFLLRRYPIKQLHRGAPYAAYLALAAVGSVALTPSSSPWCSWCSSVWSTPY